MKIMMMDYSDGGKGTVDMESIPDLKYAVRAAYNVLFIVIFSLFFIVFFVVFVSYALSYVKL